MTKYDCEICQGRGTIRLPVYRRAVAVFDASVAIAIDEDSRQYPCPECSEAVPLAQIGIVGSIQAIDTRIDDPRYIERVKHATAMSLMSEIVKGGYVKVENGPSDTRNLCQEFRATVGVVSPKQVATLEERIAERQIEVAMEVVAEAQQQISNWGSYYGHSEILKRDANRMVDDAVKAVLAKRAAWKPT